MFSAKSLIGGLLAVFLFIVVITTAFTASVGADSFCDDDETWSNDFKQCVSAEDDSNGNDDGCFNNVCHEEMAETFDQIANFVIFLVAIVAFPNGAYGIFQWMTAGSDPQQTSKGKARVKRTFFALGGVAALKFVVTYLTILLV